MPNRRFNSSGRSGVRFLRQDSQVEEEEDQGKVSPEKEPTTGAEGGVDPDEGSVSRDRNGAGAISKRESKDVYNKREELSGEDGAKSMRENEGDRERTNAKKDQKKDNYLFCQRSDSLDQTVWYVRPDSQLEEEEEDQGEVSPEKEPTTGAEGGVAPDEGSVSRDQNGAKAISKRESEDVYDKREELSENEAKSMKKSEDDLERTNAKKDKKRDKAKWKFTLRKKKDKSHSRTNNKTDEGENRRRKTKEDLLIELRNNDEIIANYEENIKRLTKERQQARSTCSQLEESLEVLLLSSQSLQQYLRTKEETLTEQSRQLEREREEKTALEERFRRLQREKEDERNLRASAERELAQERRSLLQDRANLERERERTATESQRRMQELQSAVSVAQEAVAEYQRLEPGDWTIRRDEVQLSEKSLGVGAWGTVCEGTFRGCQVAVKCIHHLILSPHNRRLFEQEMSTTSRCRHPNLLQFIGATNDDGIPLFITELLDTDLRSILSRRALHHEEIVCLALDVARALNYLHLNKPFPIMHRDISSSNVLLWRRDNTLRAKLSVYGAANFMRQYMTENPGAMIYAAPESFTSRQSPKADVFSFGLLLCEMCTRELPVPQQIQQQIGLVSNGVLRELVMRCVETSPEARPAMSHVIGVLLQQAETLRAQGRRRRSATL